MQLLLPLLLRVEVCGGGVQGRLARLAVLWLALRLVLWAAAGGLQHSGLLCHKGSTSEAWHKDWGRMLLTPSLLRLLRMVWLLLLLLLRRLLLLPMRRELLALLYPGLLPLVLRWQSLRLLRWLPLVLLLLNPSLLLQWPWLGYQRWEVGDTLLLLLLLRRVRLRVSFHSGSCIRRRFHGHRLQKNDERCCSDGVWVMHWRLSDMRSCSFKVHGPNHRLSQVLIRDLGGLFSEGPHGCRCHGRRRQPGHRRCHGLVTFAECLLL